MILAFLRGVMGGQKRRRSDNPHPQAAIAYSRMGLSIIAADPTAKRPLPRSWEDWKDRRPSEAQLRVWWATWPAASPFLVCGKISGLVVLDADNIEALGQTLNGFRLPPTAVARTPSGG